MRDTRGVERHVHLQPLRPRRLAPSLQPDRLQHVAGGAGHGAAFDDRRRSARIEVEHDRPRRVEIVGERHRGVDLDRRHVGGPHHRRRLVDAAVLDPAPPVTRPERDRHPFRADAQGTASRRNRRVRAVGIPPERQRPAGQMRDRDRRDPRHVVDHLRLGEPARIEDLVEVADRQPASIDLDLDRRARHDRRSEDQADFFFSAAFLTGADLVAFAVERALLILVGAASLLVSAWAAGCRPRDVLGGADARLERSHQVDDLGLLGRQPRVP